MITRESDGSQGLTPCAADITSFLNSFRPSIHVLAIAQDGGNPNGRYFGDDVKSATDFSCDFNARNHNIYFTVNQPAPNCGYKPSKSQIVGIRVAHVDIDTYKPASPFNKEAAIKAVGEGKPTLIVDSGNGLHAYWVLAEAVPATADNIVLIEAVNKALVARYGGDQSAWNVDRVLRVPGTVNWPDAKKRTIGRVPCMARVLS